MSQRIVAAARGWIGTPYVHQASVKGAGTDCLGLVRGIWRELYGPEPEALPAYTPDWGEAGAQGGRGGEGQVLARQQQARIAQAPDAPHDVRGPLARRVRRHIGVDPHDIEPPRREWTQAGEQALLEIGREAVDRAPGSPSTRPRRPRRIAPAAPPSRMVRSSPRTPPARSSSSRSVVPKSTS